MKKFPKPAKLREKLEAAHSQGILALVVSSFFWGTTYIATKDALATIPPSLLVLSRFAIAALVFIPWLKLSPPLMLAGLELGFWLVAGYGTQTVGLLYTTAGRSAFISALFIILVPLILGLRGRRIPALVWFAAGLAFGGIGLMSAQGSGLNRGDLWSLATAFCWAFYIIRLETQAQTHKPLELTASQLWSISALALVWVLADLLWSDTSAFPGQTPPWGTLLYLGLGATALTTWLQTFGQRRVSPPEAVVIFTLEPVFAAVLALMLLGERLSISQLLGAVLILIATLLSQWSRGE